MTYKFDEIITDRARFREIMDEPSSLVQNKTINHIDDICKKYIEASPFIILTTIGADGLLDTSPKGDFAGFVKILDKKTLAIPERLGNHLADSFENILINPTAGLIFIIPGFGITLRVAGKARIATDKKLQAQMSVNGKEPELILVIDVEEAFAHCSKAIMRSKIWQSKYWPNTVNLPNLGQAMVTHGALNITANEMQDIVINDENKRLY